MMTDWHDSATKLFKENPTLVAEVLRDLMGVPMAQDVKPVPLPQVLSDKPPNDLIPDLAFLAGPARKPSRCFIVELQTKMTKEKRRQWPRYVTTLWARYECPVELLVICPSKAAAHACSDPIFTNLERFVCVPKALFPEEVPAMTRPQEMEDLLNSTYRMPHSPTLRKKFEEGREEEAVTRERKTIFKVLRARNLTPTEEQSQLIESCDSLGTLELWSDRAETATRTDDVFKD